MLPGSGSPSPRLSATISISSPEASSARTLPCTLLISTSWPPGAQPCQRNSSWTDPTATDGPPNTVSDANNMTGNSFIISSSVVEAEYARGSPSLTYSFQETWSGKFPQVVSVFGTGARESGQNLT